MTHATANGRATPGSYAADYRDSGLSIIPIRGDGSKAPAVGSWLPYQSRLPSADDINRWFIADNVGIAIVHGIASGNSELIDIDNADVFGPYCAEVERLAPGLVQRLTIIQTPRPGFHLIYRCDTVEGNQVLARTRLLPIFNEDGTPDIDPKTGEQKTETKALVETRGQGGYALAPGSPAECHETGRLYEHFSGPELTELPTITPRRTVDTAASRSVVQRTCRRGTQAAQRRRAF